MSARTKIAPLSGFPELLPEQRIAEQQILDIVREVFELHAFAPIETRSVEPVERLLGKGGDADKEIYGVSRLAGEAGKAELGLHFDLTVPFARYVLENSGRLTFPFRRYQIQKSWRGERPQEGRFREFTQADIDIVDADTLAAHHESDIPLVVAEVFDRLPIGDVVIQVNNRKIPEGYYRGLGIEDINGTLRIVDKLDKIGPDKVRDLLVASSLSEAQAKAVTDLADISSADTSFVDRVRDLGVSDPLLDEGLAALADVVAVGAQARPGVVVADLRIARGLDYYTGTVYEVRVVGQESWGAVGAGGRYDSLASDGSATYPGVGMSIGITRLVHLLVAHRNLRASRASTAAVLVAVFDDDSRDDSRAVAAALRGRGIACEVSPTAAKFGKQIRYADRRGIPFVWFPGGGDGDEVKDIRSGDQGPADRSSWLPPEQDRVPRLVVD